MFYLIFVPGMAWFLYGANRVGGKVINRLESIQAYRRVNFWDVILAAGIFIYASLFWPITRRQI